MKKAEVDLVNYRLEKAQTTLNEAKALIDREYLNGALYRLYYSCFYAVNALLLTKNITPKTHNGTRNKFQVNFVHKGVISNELSIFYSKMFNLRHESDYEDYVEHESETVRSLFAQSQEFIKVIKEQIKEKSAE